MTLEEKVEEYWTGVAEKLVWFKKWDTILNFTGGISKWFPGGLFNVCYNCIDRNVEDGKGSKVAFIYDSPLTKQAYNITYSELQQDVEKFAWVLSDLGVVPGDRVVIYMPKIVEGLVGMLACSRIGAVQCALYTGLSVIQIAHRITLFEPKVIVTSNTGFQNGQPVNLKRNVDEAIEISSYKPLKCLVVRRPDLGKFDFVPERDVIWEDIKRGASRKECFPLEATEPIYLLQTSGTTGAPKAVIAPSAGFAVGILGQLSALYGYKGDEVFFTTSEYGWQVAQDYICYGALLLGCTSVVYEGDPVGTPDSEAFFRLIDKHKITRLITNVSAFRGIRKTSPDGPPKEKYHLNSLRDIMVTGEASDLRTMLWAAEKFGVPVIDGYGQTGIIRIL